MGEGTSTERADAARPRACLLLSLLILLYNLAAFGRQGFLNDPPIRRTAGPVPPAVTADNVAARAVGARKGPPTLRQRFLAGYRIDINRAGPDEITLLPGISDPVAAAVVAQRLKVGRFATPDALLDVRGIKEKRLQKILPFLGGFDNN
jgi:hypothetical protein